MMSKPTRIAATIAALSLLALASACSLTRSPPTKESYLLEPAWPAVVSTSQKGSVRVGTVTVAAPFRGRSFVVRDSAQKFDSDFYHEFFVPPGVMIGDATAQAIAHARVFTEVSRPGVNVDANWVLDGFVSAIYADGRDAAKPVAVLDITYYLSRDDGGVSSPVWSKSYARRVSFGAENSGAYVAALNTALSETLAELARDLAAAQLPAS